MTTDLRTERALATIDRGGLGLEIGPSYNPLLPKRSGARIETVDHATRDELVAKYQGYGLPQETLDRIEAVDHVWAGGSLVDSIGRPGAYDYILASNVIEHTVDLIGWLRDCEALLAPGGRLALIVPDQRYCFDLFKPLTSIAQVVDAHLRPTRFHPPGALLEHTAYACTRGGAIAWGPGDDGPLALQFADVAVGRQQIAEGDAQDAYFDNHRWKFTPASFSLLIQDLRDLGYHGLGEVAGSPPPLGFEFFVTLGRHDPAAQPRHDRLALLERVRAERLEVDAGAELASLRAELAALRASRWWRATAPGRRLTAALRHRLGR